jgi:hypothetical protein
MGKSRKFKHNVVAIVYDFDGTLSPGAMQDYTILPALGIKPQDFWRRVEKESIRTRGESTLTYMRLLIDECKKKNYKFSAAELNRLARKVRFFPGVTGYFERINRFVKKEFKDLLQVRHYIISAGLKEIIEFTPIAKHIHRIFASEYFFDGQDRASFPKVLVNDTLKTQFLFRINKGIENLNENINHHMSEEDRVIPFENILYIGDGMTDVPSMAVAKQQGGHSLAVYKARNSKGLKVCKELLNVSQADFIAEADFRKGSTLERLIQLVLKNMAEKIAEGRETFTQRSSYLKGR